MGDWSSATVCRRSINIKRVTNNRANCRDISQISHELRNERELTGITFHGIYRNVRIKASDERIFNRYEWLILSFRNNFLQLELFALCNSKVNWIRIVWASRSTSEVIAISKLHWRPQCLNQINWFLKTILCSSYEYFSTFKQTVRKFATWNIHNPYASTSNESILQLIEFIYFTKTLQTTIIFVLLLIIFAPKFINSKA